MKRGLIGLLLLASISLAGNSVGFQVTLFIPSSYTLNWNVVSTTAIINYPLQVTSDQAVSMNVSGNGFNILSGPAMVHDFVITLNSGMNTLNLSAIDAYGLVKTLQGFVNVVPEQSTLSVGGSTQSIGVEIPVGAVDQFYTLSANVVTQSFTLPNTASKNGLFIEIKLVSSTGNVVPTAQFDVPVILQLPYFGSVTQGVAVAYLDTRVSPSVWRYDGVRVLSVDVAAKKVWVAVDHFTIFGVFTFTDIEAPVISEIKANALGISNGSFIGALPIFSMLLAESRPSDSGIVSYNVSLVQVGGPYSRTTTNALVASAQVSFYWDITDIAISDGDYRLIISVEDAAGLIVTKSISLVRRSEAQIQNFLLGPNPVNIKQSAVHLTYDLSKSMATTIRVFDVAGRRVRIIQSASGVNGGRIGQNDIVWDGRTDQGDMVPAGLYIVYIYSDADGVSSAKRFMLLVTK